jgi:RNA polymerase sigma-70 factor (ECF subfamily)
MATLGLDLWLPLPHLKAKPRDADQLVERLRAGQAAAIAEVYDKESDAIRAYARRLVGDEMIAEDLVQEVFVALPRAIRHYRSEASLRTFLFSIATNQARHHVRAASRRRTAFHRLAEEPGKGGPPSPEDRASGGELARQLSCALDEPPLNQRVAFVLCEVEERTSTEVAAIVGASEGTVRTRVFHAKKKLQAMLVKRGVRQDG